MTNFTLIETDIYIYIGVVDFPSLFNKKIKRIHVDSCSRAKFNTSEKQHFNIIRSQNNSIISRKNIFCDLLLKHNFMKSQVNMVFSSFPSISRPPMCAFGPLT